MESVPTPASPPANHLPPTPPTPANNFNAPPPLEALPPEQHPHHKHRKLMIIIAAVTMFVISGVAWGAMLLFPSPEATNDQSNQPATSAETETEALIRLTHNAERKSDVGALLVGLAGYAANNQGNIPVQIVTAEKDKTMTFCDDQCRDTSEGGHPEMVTLTRYDPNKLSFKAYAANFTAPDAETLTIVTGATCRDDTALGNAGSDRQVAIVFALATAGGGLEQRCSGN